LTLILVAIAGIGEIVFVFAYTLAGTPLFDLGHLIAEVRETPKDYIWLYVMLFSTVVPTAIHFILCLFSLQSWYVIIPSLRQFISDKIANSPTSPFAATMIPFVIGFVWAVPFLGAEGLIWSIWMSAADSFAWFGGHYLDQMLRLAQWIEAI
jgi:hypothetical protein